MGNDLIDEYCLRINPNLVGGGHPAVQASTAR